MSSDNLTYLIHTLPNDLRAVVRQADSNVSYIGAMVNAGSRDESASTEGLAHFVEHTIFKGTRHRRSCHIASRMESIGGELNAYTTKEETMVYTNAPAGYAGRSFDLISDLVKNSIFPDRELTKEKEVIIEEINSYRDSPADAVYDEYEELIYAGSGLAHNILGTPDSVRSLSSHDARGFIDRFYTPGNMVIYCSDPGDPERNIRLIEKYFGDMRFPGAESERKEIPMVEPFDISRRRDNHQANCITGARLFSRTDPRRYAMFLLNNYLGGPGMNSRLNMEMRDRRGLVYTVESNVALMSDTGVLLIYYGCDPENMNKCKRIIRTELDRLAQSPLSARAFAQAQDQYCGQLIMSGEHRESRAMSMAKSLMYYGEIHDIDFATDHIRALKPEDIQNMAAEILRTGLSTLSI
ncbi:MAG: insulinase family protein [Muribaculaceae bacterium]|nr:insulinase family protein [Muribaculaceae bacterium]